jgi:hypothetical protein
MSEEERRGKGRLRTVRLELLSRAKNRYRVCPKARDGAVIYECSISTLNFNLRDFLTRPKISRGMACMKASGVVCTAASAFIVQDTIPILVQNPITCGLMNGGGGWIRYRARVVLWRDDLGNGSASLIAKIDADDRQAHEIPNTRLSAIQY